MELNRRDFLKLSGASMVGAVALASISETKPVAAAREFPLASVVKETNTICCYCSVGCGAIVTTWKDDQGEHIKIEGDPDHPVNQGSLCPKGHAMYQIHSAEATVGQPINDQRVTKPKYRAPGALDWDETKTMDEILDMIARRVKDTRDSPGNFVTIDGDGKMVNRHEKMGSFGGGELDNEECYLLAKMSRALGVVYLEHCARL